MEEELYDERADPELFGEGGDHFGGGLLLDDPLDRRHGEKSARQRKKQGGCCGCVRMWQIAEKSVAPAPGSS